MDSILGYQLIQTMMMDEGWTTNVYHVSKPGRDVTPVYNGRSLAKAWDALTQADNCSIIFMKNKLVDGMEISHAGKANETVKPASDKGVVAEIWAEFQSVMV